MGRRRRATWVPPGVLVLHKPIGATSHDVVDFLRRLLPPRARVGHSGTLDPFAEGVLPICVGGMTRLADRLGHQPKVYRARLDLRQDRDSGDPTGMVVAEHDLPAGSPGRTVLDEVLAGFLGEIEQTPPAFSAIHVDGERAYQRARRGEVVEMPSRKVTIHEIALLEDAWPVIEFRVCCSRGTYVRTLGQDIGRALGFGGFLESLVRESVGAMTLEHARTHFDCLRGDLTRAYSPLEVCFPEIERLELDPEQADRILQGNAVPAGAGFLGADPGREFFLFAPGGEDLLALARVEPDGKLQPQRVMGRKD